MVHRHRAVLTLARQLLPAVFGNMARVATQRTNNPSCEVWLLRTLPGLVCVVATVRTAGSIGLTQSSVQESKFPQLHPAKIILSFWNLNTLPDHFLDPLHRLLDTLQVVASHKGVQRLILAGHWAILAPHLAFFDRAFATDYDLGASIFLHRLERVASGSNQQTHKVDVRIGLLRNHHLVGHFDHWWLVISGRLIFFIDLVHSCNSPVPFLFKLPTSPILASIEPLALIVVNGFRGWRPFIWISGDAKIICAESPAQLFNLQLQ